MVLGLVFEESVRWAGIVVVVLALAGRVVRKTYTRTEAVLLRKGEC